MKKSLAMFSSFVIAFGLAGCVSGTPGGPGRDTGKQPIIGQADGTFSLSPTDISLRQGETKSVAIGIKRGMNFDEDVTVRIGDLPQGLSVDNKHPVVRHGDAETRFMISASEDASLGEFNVTITGHPEKGSDATNSFKVTVTKNPGS